MDGLAAPTFADEWLSVDSAPFMRDFYKSMTCIFSGILVSCYLSRAVMEEVCSVEE
jgi:hypothetical protein